MAVFHCVAQLGQRSSEPSAAAETDLELINQQAPQALKREDVYIRSMVLCSNQLCESDWCRFSEQALEQIAGLVVGESVLAGHDRRSLPVGRFFRAEVVESNGRAAGSEQADPDRPGRWVRAWFYWLRETEGAEDLLRKMDGGIYREVSIAWRYRGGRCAICGEPLAVCPHEVGGVYDGQRCYCWIDEVLEVLEGSLVYRGADRSTTILGEHHQPTIHTMPAQRTIPVELEQIVAFEIAPLLNSANHP